MGNGTSSWKEAITIYTRPRVFAMIFLGFSAGLPFLLVFSTLTLWLREADVARTTIGFFSWVGITYSIKVLWAPVVDRLPFPLLTAMLGKRRSWMLVAQLAIAAGLAGMAITDPQTSLTQMAVLALLVAFGSATQDITIDAWRIEAVEREWQGAMAATYVLGYRLALLVAGAGALYIAEYTSWTTAYMAMSLLMSVGMLTTLVLSEPTHKIDSDTQALEKKLESIISVQGQDSLYARITAWFSDAMVSPFADFFQRNGALAILILLLVGAYKLSDITMGVMANPFYYDLGFSKTDIANISKIFGFFMSILGAGLGGILVVRYGVLRPLLAGAILVASTNLLFVWLAYSGPDITLLAVVISADNLAGGIATSAFIAWLSSLVNQSYTATQYALFSSLMTLPAKFLGGFSGMVVDSAGYASFFLYAALLGIPAILLVALLMHRQAKNSIPP